VGNAPLGEGRRGVGGFDRGKRRVSVGNLDQATDADRAVEKEFLGLETRFCRLPLEEVVHEADGILDVVDGVGDPGADRTWKDEFVGLVQRREHVVVELVIEPEDAPVDGLDRVGDRVACLAVVITGIILRSRRDLTGDGGFTEGLLTVTEGCCTRGAGEGMV